MEEPWSETMAPWVTVRALMLMPVKVEKVRRERSWRGTVKATRETALAKTQTSRGEDRVPLVVSWVSGVVQVVELLMVDWSIRTVRTLVEKSNVGVKVDCGVELGTANEMLTLTDSGGRVVSVASTKLPVESTTML